MAAVSVCQGYICIHDSELVDGWYISYMSGVGSGIWMYTHAVLHSNTWYRFNNVSIGLNLEMIRQNLLRLGQNHFLLWVQKLTFYRIKLKIVLTIHLNFILIYTYNISMSTIWKKIKCIVSKSWTKYYIWCTRKPLWKRCGRACFRYTKKPRNYSVF